MATQYSEMVERIARALSEIDRIEADEAPDFADWHWEENVERAKAAIEAMREPTKSMKQVGINYITSNLRHEEVYPHMIDAALREDP